MITYTALGLGLALAALLVCMTNIAFTMMDGHTAKPQNRIYIAILSMLAINAGCEVVNTWLGDRILESDRAYLAVQISQYVYFLTHTFMAPLFYFYINHVTGRSVDGSYVLRKGTSRLRYFLSLVPVTIVVIEEVFLSVNPITHWAWFYGADRSFHRAWGEYVVVYAMSAVWIVASFVVVMRSWNILSKNRKWSIAFCFCLVEIGVVTQLLSKSLRMEILMEALGFTGVLLFIENEDDRKNVELGVYNAAAFSLDLNAKMKNRIPTQVIIVRNIRFNKTANTFVPGRVDRDTIRLAVAEFLSTKTQPWYIYAIGHGRFALTVFNSSDEETMQTAREIADRFHKPWDLGGTDVYLTASVMLVDVLKRARAVEDVLYIAECPIPEDLDRPVLAGTDLDWIVRHAAVEKAVTEGLEKGSFEVYYQPTYCMDKSLHGAEALLRMHDETLGTIYPDEFIPVAEQLGLIDDLDEYVLKEVCKFIMTGIPQQYGMECINLNLSVLECMKDGFADHVSRIVENAGVRKKLINFEITESVAAKDYEHLSVVIEKLKQEGFLFSIDDYGTGYSNMTALFSLGADVIKIDKSILWNAGKSALGMTLLKTSIEMVHEMHKRSLMEGVETEEQIRI
ncbi:MAG: EAL domain-containing protein, partial [Oscillospiraceae bacterium]|nr:EAL domain-containing protein [Oscillospiraceae bacterium]